MLLRVIPWAATVLALPPLFHQNHEFPILAIDKIAAGRLAPEQHGRPGTHKQFEHAISPGDSGGYSSDLESWLAQQKSRAFSYILDNVGGVSSVLSAEVSPGVVIASPSKTHPNYFFYWVRDAALTVRTLVGEFSQSQGSTAATLKRVIESYIESNYLLQRTPNRSGDFGDRAGLGEPKFLPNNSAFEGDWGRPQADGPALRASTIFYYLNVLQSRGESIDSGFLGNVSFVYDQMIKPDLEYVISSWRKPSFDLWEEINSGHFFNAMVQLKGLEDGLAMAEAQNDSDFASQLKKNHHELNEFVQSEAAGFISPGVTHVIETPSLHKDGARSGLDAAIFLASLHAHDGILSEKSDIPFDVDDIHVLNTISAMAKDMVFRYEINRDKRSSQQPVGVALGRYPEDIYDGYEQSENGNPWFISVNAAAEVLYRFVDKTMRQKRDLFVTDETREFYSMFMESTDSKTGQSTISYGTVQHTRVLTNIFNYADSFLQIVREHVDQDHGRMSEQFNRDGGYMQGAHDLTWSYCSFVEAVKQRTSAQGHIQ